MPYGRRHETVEENTVRTHEVTDIGGCAEASLEETVIG